MWRGRGLMRQPCVVDPTASPDYQPGTSCGLPKEFNLSSQYVHVVDDDRDVRCSISFMLNAADLQSRPFASGADFLDSLPDLRPGCILLDVRMPEVDGFQVMAELAKEGVEWPVIVMTGHGEVPVAVRAMKLGAVDFIEKPFDPQQLVTAIEHAKERIGAPVEAPAAQDARQLSEREREVMALMVQGLHNRRIAEELGISHRTVEIHKARVMEKMGVKSLVELVRLVDRSRT